MNKKTVKKVLMRGGLTAVSFSLALAGAYFLTPARTRVVNLGGNNFVRPNNDEQESFQELKHQYYTYLQQFDYYYQELFYQIQY